MYTKHTDKRNKEAFKIQTDNHVKHIPRMWKRMRKPRTQRPKGPKEGRSCKPLGTG